MTVAKAPRDPRSLVNALVVVLSVVLLSAWPSRASAQLPECAGSDPAGARAELAAGTRLLQQAIEEARRRGPRVRALAADALEHFDRQCALGDRGALAERGAALMLMGEPLRSAQSYDAFLRVQPLGALDARRRRRIEANLQPGEAIVEIDRGAARLFVDGLDFGPLPRSTAVRLPPGGHRFEARAGEGTVLAQAAATLEVGAGPAMVRLALPPSSSEPRTEPDLTPWYVATATLAGASLAAGIGFLAAVDERQRTYDAVCTLGLPAEGCEAVLVERDAALGLSVTGFVLAGLSVIGLVTVAVIDLGEPRVAIGARPQAGGALLSASGAF